MQVHQLDIDYIDIDDRFRENPADDIEPLMDSIKNRGQLQPIVVAHVGELVRLLCGRRRLEAHFRLAKENPSFQMIHGVFKDELSRMEQKIVELEENVRRKDFNDLEKIKAINKIHVLMCEGNSSCTMRQTATYLGFHETWISRALQIGT